MPLDATTAITLNGITAWDESVRENWSRRGDSQATRILRTAWGDRLGLIAYLLGSSTQIGPIEVRDPPQAYPGAEHLVAQAASVDGQGVPSHDATGNVIAYPWAVITVTYAPDKGEPPTSGGGGGGAEEIGSERLDFAAEHVIVPSDEPAFKWASDDAELPAGAIPVIRQGSVSFVKAVRDVPELPVALVLSLIDHVNSETIFGAAPGTLLFNGAAADRRFTTAGTTNFDMLYAMTWKRQGHNRLFRPSTGTYEEVVAIGSGEPMHPEGDLRQLFR